MVSKKGFLKFNESNSEIKENKVNLKMTYGKFLYYLETGSVKTVDLYDNQRVAIVEVSNPELSDRPQKLRVEIPKGATQLIGKLREERVNIVVHAPKKDGSSLRAKVLKQFTAPFILIILYFLLFRRSNNSNPNVQGLNFRKTQVSVQLNPNTGVKFDDVAGINEVKNEFQEVKAFIKDPFKFTRLGANLPKGLLLLGPPGTGKTLLAKAIAGESRVPFISISGSEFVEMFVGMGAYKVRELFKEAKKNLPCIIFIDEIDAVARRRGTGIGGGNDEREQTLNQLLTEMDGFEDNKGVIVIAATNRSDILDPALLRAGRFDRQVQLNLPDVTSRYAILKVHARDKNLSEKISLWNIALITTGFSGADLANILNEAALIAARKKKDIIDTVDIGRAIDRVLAGLEGVSLADSKNKRLIGYHEAGHAVVGTILKKHDNVQKVTLLPRGDAKGLTWFLPENNNALLSRSKILTMITGVLGGRAAEDIVFGFEETTTGAANDLTKVTSMAQAMILRYGMSNIGPLALVRNSNDYMFFSSGIKAGYSDSVTLNIRTQMQTISALCYREAIEIVKSNRLILDRVVEKLIEQEIISGKSCHNIISEYTKVPTQTKYQSKFSRS